MRDFQEFCVALVYLAAFFGLFGLLCRHLIKYSSRFVWKTSQKESPKAEKEDSRE